MPRLVDDTAIESYKRVGLLPRDKQVAEVEKKEPVLVNVTVRQDTTAIDRAIIELVKHSTQEKPKSLEQWEFIVQRDDDGNMTTILAKQLE